MTLLALTIMSIIVGVRQSKHIMANGEAFTGTKRALLIFLLCVTGYLVVAWVDALMISRFGDKIFPVVVGAVTLLGCLLLLVRMMRSPETDQVFVDLETGGDDGSAPHGLWSTLSWFLGLLVLSTLFDFIIALTAFFFTFFKVRARTTTLSAILLAAAGIAFISFLASTLGRDFPPSLLQSYISLPWPLR